MEIGQSILYRFNVDSGAVPFAGVILDNTGDLYGTTYFDGYGAVGTVYELTPSGSGWTGNVLFGFRAGDGANPFGGLIFDKSGNLYGTTTAGGSGGAGTVFELTPSNGSWVFAVLYAFTGNSYGPRAKLVMDESGNLYGVRDSLTAPMDTVRFSSSPHIRTGAGRKPICTTSKAAQTAPIRSAA